MNRVLLFCAGLVCVTGCGSRPWMSEARSRGYWPLADPQVRSPRGYEIGAVGVVMRDNPVDFRLLCNPEEWLGSRLPQEPSLPGSASNSQSDLEADLSARITRYLEIGAAAEASNVVSVTNPRYDLRSESTIISSARPTQECLSSIEDWIRRDGQAYRVSVIQGVFVADINATASTQAALRARGGECQSPPRGSGGQSSSEEGNTEGETGSAPTGSTGDSTAVTEEDDSICVGVAFGASGRRTERGSGLVWAIRYTNITSEALARVRARDGQPSCSELAACGPEGWNPCTCRYATHTVPMPQVTLGHPDQGPAQLTLGDVCALPGHRVRVQLDASAGPDVRLVPAHMSRADARKEIGVSLFVSDAQLARAESNDQAGVTRFSSSSAVVDVPADGRLAIVARSDRCFCNGCNQPVGQSPCEVRNVRVVLEDLGQP